MKKIGLVTFHTPLNYGAVLQAYALQNFLNENGFENEIIDYRSRYIEKCYKPFFISNGKVLNSIARGILFGGLIKKRKRKFRKFVNERLQMSSTLYSCDDIRKVEDSYRYFITGSDQVWSPISAGFDITYFLPFTNEKKKYSYAASIGCTQLSEEENREIKERIKEFRIISVREESAKKIILDMYPLREVFVNVDPTLLLDGEQWVNLVEDKIINEPYLLLFNVEKPIKDIEYAKKIAKKNGWKLVYINDRTVKKDKDIIYFEAVSPEEFLTLFFYAKMIITNSFHGTVFSIIFKKQFLVETDNKKQTNVRVKDLLKKLEISDREISEDKICNLPDEPNWENVNKVLKKEQQKSLEYFKKLEEINR